MIPEQIREILVTNCSGVVTILDDTTHTTLAPYCPSGGKDYLSVVSQIVGTRYADANAVLDMQGKFRKGTDPFFVVVDNNASEKYPHAVGVYDLDLRHLGHVPDLLAKAIHADMDNVVASELIHMTFNYDKTTTCNPYILLFIPSPLLKDFTITTFMFGKYKGKSYREVFESDPAYIGWACEKSLIQKSAFSVQEIEHARVSNLAKEVNKAAQDVADQMLLDGVF